MNKIWEPPSSVFTPISLTIKALLSDSACYRVPIYQRNYDWGEGEISQLLADIEDYAFAAQTKPYYIGSLVVASYESGFDVIDGQQRLTTLTLLVLALRQLIRDNGSDLIDWYTACNLDFACRPTSSRVLQDLFNGVSAELTGSLWHGYQLLYRHLRKLKQQGDRLQTFCDYLFEWVMILRVPLPADIDVNHYFEAMNNRGEQLEQHEVLKARLASCIDANAGEQREQIKAVFYRVWDTVANMERYLQYGFSPKERDQLFGSDWGQLTVSRFDELLSKLEAKATDTTPCTLATILADATPLALSEKTRCGQTGNYDTADDANRFDSLISFPHFLLHVLQLSLDPATDQNITLDDKKLIAQFEQHLLVDDGKLALVNIQGFTFNLFKAKFLLDQFVIKRDAEHDQRWQIQKMHLYKASSFAFIQTFASNAKALVMLQSALHVSAPAQSYKYWLNGVLKILFELADEQGHINADEYLQELEALARAFVYGRYLRPEQSESYYALIALRTYPALSDVSQFAALLRYQTIRNNLLFNYLDYLIWRSSQTQKDPAIDKFVFTNRSSVEHLHPQNPAAAKRLDESVLDSFGNLFLVSHSENSRLSNQPVEGKIASFMYALANSRLPTLKVYKMLQTFKKYNAWDEAQIHTHEQQMLQLFIDDASQGKR